MVGMAEKKQTDVKYDILGVAAIGSFGTVYQATISGTNQIVAIKKILQDKRYKQRELQMMQTLSHPNVVKYMNFFFSSETDGKNFLNIVMEYQSSTIYQLIRSHATVSRCIPFEVVKCCAYQMVRAIAYIHSLGICHRDVKPQNFLLNPKTAIVKICDFGSAKILGKNNVSYICSRFYRAPELILESSEYTHTVDIWSIGCIISELFLGAPLFMGSSGSEQIIEIMKLLGPPSREDVFAMNPKCIKFSHFPVESVSWSELFKHVKDKNTNISISAIDFIKRHLVYQPDRRVNPLDALGHEFFASLRIRDAKLPNGIKMPPLFDFTNNEKSLINKRPSLVEVLFG